MIRKEKQCIHIKAEIRSTKETKAAQFMQGKIIFSFFWIDMLGIEPMASVP